MTERWKLIDGTAYAVSDLGKILRVDKGRIVATSLSPNGYAHVLLCTNGVTRTYSIHRLVAQAFIPNPEGKAQVNHKDFIRHHNAATNLEWATGSENLKYSYRSGRGGPRTCHPLIKPLIAVLDNGTTERFISVRAAERAGHYGPLVRRRLNGEQTQYHKRTWRYDDTTI